jgi:phenylalanyl-tRNA synthetase beta chain
MKTPLSWISLYTPLQKLMQDHSIKDLAHEYSIHTAEIDGIEECFFDKVVVGKVLSCEKHPESKKLSIVEVSLGESVTMILTGAPNISEATYVPVATLWARLSEDFVIGERMMAGMMSLGMICGADEIGITQTPSTGIMILEEDWDIDYLEARVGTSFFDLELPFPGVNGTPARYTLKDIVFEIDNKFITNRPDLFSVYGNAREWHAVFDTPFVPYTPRRIPESDTLNVHIETDKVLAYSALKMTISSVASSPFSITLMMERAGLSPKLDIVDITNCMMSEFWQPMHVFDADTIEWDIHVRMARSGESLIVLNDVHLHLTSEDIVIADDVKVLALAWVIWGKESAVTESTTNVVWESATFDPVTVRLTAQRHGIRTDASTRYEKSLDPLLPEFSFGRVLDYLDFLNKEYTIISRSCYLHPNAVKHTEIEVTYEYLSKKIGIDIPHDTTRSILSKLGFEIRSSWDLWFTVIVPSWRATKDINIPEDIAEEVGRVYGYDHVELSPVDAKLRINTKNNELTLRNSTLLYFRDSWWNEVYNYSFTNLRLDTALGFPNMDSAIAIKNAFNEEYTHMRRTLANRLFENIRDNLKYSKSLRFFEIGKVYSHTIERSSLIEPLLKKQTTLPFPEKKILAGITTGMDLETFRTLIEGYLMKHIYHIPPLHQGMINPLSFLHPQMSGEYREGETSFIKFGYIHPETATFFELPLDTLYFEVNYEHIIVDRDESDRLRFHPISRFQSTSRELNFVMDIRKNTGEIARFIDALSPWIHDVTVDSVYEDEQKIGEWKKSVNFAFTLCSEENTISDREALDLQNHIIESMKVHNCTLR